MLLYAAFKKRLLEVIADYSTLIPGKEETVKKLRSAGIRIGSTTGCNAEKRKKIAPEAALFGYAPDSIITSDDMGVGRPAPYMMFACMQKLEIYPPCCNVRVETLQWTCRRGRTQAPLQSAFWRNPA